MSLRLAGTGYVLHRATGREELPFVEEVERFVGLDEGATAAPGATEDDRRQACGNIFDANVLTHFMHQFRPFFSGSARILRAGQLPPAYSLELRERAAWAVGSRQQGRRQQ